MRRRAFIGGVAALAGLQVLTPHPARAQGTLEKLRFVTIPHDSLTPLYYGMEHGQFQRAGIDLEIVLTSSGAAATTAVIAGAYEIGNSSLLATMAAHLHGIPIGIVAPMSIYTPKNPASLLQVAPDATFKSGPDLNGKTVAVSALHDLSDLGIRAWVDKTGGDARTLEFVEIPNTAMVAALQQRRVVAGLMNEPLLDISIVEGQTKTLGDALGAIAPTFMYGGLIARSDWANEHADVVRRFRGVVTTMAAYTNVHPAETVAMMADVTKVPVAVMEKVRRVLCATTLDPRQVQPLIDCAATYQEIDRTFPAQELFW